MSFWAYMLHCRGGAYYVGHSDDLERRIGQHESGLVAGFTADKLPVRLVWSQEFATRPEALAAERQIKGWGRAKKMALIRGDWDAVSRLARKQDSPSTGSGRTVFDEGIFPPTTVRPELVEACPELGRGGLFLLPHPAQTNVAVVALRCWPAVRSTHLDLRFHLRADMAALIIPPPVRPARTDGLWQTTCFELFLRGSGDPYVEWNFAPSGAWAAYAFDSYRAGRCPLDAPAPAIRWQAGAEAGALDASIPIAPMIEHIGPRPWRANITAVIETAGGTVSHWALAHPDGPPDFHDPACFVLPLA